MISKLLLLFLLSAISLDKSDGAKILGVFNVASRSHYILGNTYLRGLAEAGHDVTMISPFEDNKPVKNGTYRNVVLTGAYEALQKKMAGFSIMERNKMKPIMMLPTLLIMSSSFTSDVLSHPNVQDLVKSGEKFDVVVIEQFMNDGLKALAPVFGAHLISFSTIGASTWVNTISGNPAPPSYVPEMILGYFPQMTFLQRVNNWFFKTLHLILLNTIYYWGQERSVKEYLPQAPPLEEVIYNSSIIFLNTHESYNHPVPTHANMINIGGFHVQKLKKLPEDLQKFLDDAPHGVIYFSLGSNVKSSDLPLNIRNGILKALSEVKEKVLWKFEEDLPGKPDNVKIGKWFPQQEILAHPNVKLFITHGGLLSTTETIHHGVPMLAIPVFGDQKMNAQTAVNAGYGLVIQLSELSYETLSTGLKEMLSNPKYREVVKYRSKTMHDREVEPMKTAIYWTEYVIRHNGAKHLRSAVLDLKWYQVYHYDIYLFVIAILIVTKLVFCKLLKVVKKICKSKSKGADKKNN